jgi:hypothetical protein
MSYRAPTRSHTSRSRRSSGSAAAGSPVASAIAASAWSARACTDGQPNDAAIDSSSAPRSAAASALWPRSRTSTAADDRLW